MADFDPFLPRGDSTFSAGHPRDDGLDDELRSTLRTMAGHARYAELAPLPAAEIRARGSRRRERRIVGGAALAGAAAVIAIVVAAAGVSGVTLHTQPANRTPAAHQLPPLVQKSGESDPAPNPADDIGYLTGAQSLDGHLVLTFDRVIWLTGEAATAANHGVKPPGGYLIVNNNPRLRTFPVKPGAVLLGNVILGAGLNGTATPISQQELIGRSLAYVGEQGKGPLVTLVHSGGPDGSVTRLEEMPTMP